MRKLTLATLTLLCGALLAPPAYSQCITATNLPNGSFRRVGIWIESDFAEELRQSTVDTTDDGTTEDQVRHFIMQTAETWNLETRGIALYYAGTGDWEFNRSFCDDVANGTYDVNVYVHFEESDETLGLMRVKAIDTSYPPCDNKRELVVAKYDDGSGNACTTHGDCPSGEDCVDNSCQDLNWWDFGSISGPGTDMTGALVHEFGHVVGLGHAHDVGECRSVMAYPSGSPPACPSPDGERHPLNWDKNCAEPSAFFGQGGWNGSGRVLSLRYQRWDINGDAHGSGTWGNLSEKGFIGANPVWWSGLPMFTTYDGALRHRLTEVTRRRTGVQMSDGTTALSNPVVLSSHHADIFALDEPPLIGRGPEFSTTLEPMRVTFLDDENDSNPNTWYNPPYTQYMRTDAHMSGAPLVTDATLYYQSGGQSFPLRTHVPLASTYNPDNGGHTVYARVETRSEHHQSGYGKIWIHGGYASSNTLMPGSSVDVLQYTLPSTGGSYDYSTRTDQHVGVACAYFWNNSHNCLVAWVENGSYDGSIMYAYFKVVGDYVQWDSPVYRRNGSRTATAPAVAYFGGHFHLAWTDTQARRVYSYRSDQPAIWTQEMSQLQPRVIGGPTFIADRWGDSLLFWYTSYN